MPGAGGRGHAAARAAGASCPPARGYLLHSLSPGTLSQDSTQRARWEAALRAAHQPGNQALRSPTARPWGACRHTLCAESPTPQRAAAPYSKLGAQNQGVRSLTHYQVIGVIVCRHAQVHQLHERGVQRGALQQRPAAAAAPGRRVPPRLGRPRKEHVLLRGGPAQKLRLSRQHACVQSTAAGSVLWPLRPKVPCCDALL